MIVMAGSFRRYGVPARPGKSTGKVPGVPLLLSSGSAYVGTAHEPAAAGHTALAQAGTICYNAYSTSSRRTNSRHPCGQSTRSRGRLVQASHRIVKTRSCALRGWGATGGLSASDCLPSMGTGRQAASGTPRSRAVCHGSGICSASGCPVGTFDNSPAIHRWVPNRSPRFSPVGTAEAFALRVVRRLHFSRPYGTEGLVFALCPSDKSLGYSHKVPTGQCPKFAVKTDAPTLRIRFVSKQNASLTFEKEKQSCTDL